MKKILYISIVFLSACASDNSYNHRCDIFVDENAPRLTGKWELVHDYTMYRVSDGGIDGGWGTPDTGILKFCDDGLGTYKPDEENIIIGLEWKYTDDNHIIINQTFFDEKLGTIRYKDTLRIMTDELEYQYWVDSTFFTTQFFTNTVIGVQ